VQAGIKDHQFFNLSDAGVRTQGVVRGAHWQFLRSE
jgi:hypothetical protein